MVSLETTEIFNPGSVIELSTRTKIEALRETAIAFHECYYPKENINYLLMTILQRELVGSTALGNGVAIPNVLVEIAAPKAVFGLSRNGVIYDNELVKFIILIAAPAKLREYYLHALAKIAKIMRNKGKRDDLLNAANKEEIYNLLTQP